MTWKDKLWKRRSPLTPPSEIVPSVRLPYSVIALTELANEDRFVLEALCRAQVQPAFLGDHTAVCRILGRYKIYVDTRDRGFGANILLDGFWEMWLTRFIAGNVKPGMVAIDVGANFGYYSLLLADLVGPAGRVLSIEPNPDVSRHLTNSIVLNGFESRTDIIAAAAGTSCADEVHLFCPQGETKNARVISHNPVSITDGGMLHTVAQISIDSLIGDGSSADFVKIDAEGAETDIISGMNETLARHKPALILEFNALRSPGPEELLQRLKDIYGQIRYIDFFGNAVAVDIGQLMVQSPGDDWLLYFATDA